MRIRSYAIGKYCYSSNVYHTLLFRKVDGKWFCFYSTDSNLGDEHLFLDYIFMSEKKFVKSMIRVGCEGLPFEAYDLNRYELIVSKQTFRDKVLLELL